MTIVSTESFKRDFRDLPGAIGRGVEKALRSLMRDPRHPSLRLKKMEGQRDSGDRDIWEARATKKHRFTLIITGNAYVLRRVGTHDILRSP